MKRIIKSFLASTLFLTASLLSLGGCKEDDTKPGKEVPALITFSSQSLYPEGIAYYPPTQTFIVSSIRQGTLGMVDLAGKYTPLLSDPDLVSTYGMKVSGNFVYVTTGDIGNAAKSTGATTGKLNKVIKVDLTQKRIVQIYDLSSLVTSAAFLNDLAIDDQENIYVTECLTGILYKIDKSGKSSLFLESNLFKGSGFNLNGIVFHQSGFLLVNKTNEGKILKINLSDQSVTEVKLPSPIEGSDGMAFNRESLYVVSYNTGTVFELKSTDNWQTAKIASKDNMGYEGATAVTSANGKPYALNAKVLEIISNPATANSKAFSIKQYQGQ